MNFFPVLSLLFLLSLLRHSSLCYAGVENERTLAMVKPDGLFGNHTDMIKNAIVESGFHIVRDMMVQLDVENVTLFYAEHSERSFFPRLIGYMTSGPVIIMVLEKHNAISHWRELIGPTDSRKARISHPNSIRALCGLDTERNCVHGSDSPQSAAREISFFFKEISHDTFTPEAHKEEFSDWPQGILLTIGTFGNNELKEESKNNGLPENSLPSQDVPDFSLEEVIKLQGELKKLFDHKPKASLEKGRDEDKLTSDTFSNCPSSLAVGRRMKLKNCSSLNDEEDGSLSPNTKIILNKIRDMLADKRSAIRQRSISFLLRKMFVCRSGFGPSPSLSDPLPESKKEKLLRAILAKKIYPQNSASTSKKKYLETKQEDRKYKNGDEVQEEGEDRCKWVKTDSEYIVLEI